ncbi:MAG: hypothetical protein DRI36_02510 [Caldiserica bacterium]|nr:MAG: hypothetical protein DRI36_02510 [Caldisericota bacterium]
MKKEKFLSISELAKLLGVSRIAVYKKVKKGEIKAIRVGRSFAIPRSYVDDILGNRLSKKKKRIIEMAVKKVVKEYGEVLKMLGRE